MAKQNPLESLLKTQHSKNISLDEWNALVNAFPLDRDMLDDGVVGTAELEDGSVTTPKLADSSVTTNKLADASVATDKLADGSTTTAKLANGSVNTDKLGNGSVTADKIADSSVTTSKIGDAQVTTSKIANGSINSDKLANGSVATDKIADLAVTTRKLANSAVDEYKLADGAVTPEKLSSGTTEELIDYTLQSEGWAVGTQDGVDVPSTSDYYHNNARYYAEQAGIDAGSASSSAQSASQSAREASASANTAVQKAAAAVASATEASAYASTASAIYAAKLDVNPNGTDNLITSNGKIADAYLPSSILGAMSFKGTWSAATGVATPTWDPGSLRKGDFWICTVQGSKFPNGQSGLSFTVGDWVVLVPNEHGGFGFSKIDADSDVTSVNGETGAVNLTAAKILNGSRSVANELATRLEFVGTWNAATGVCSPSFSSTTHHAGAYWVCTQEGMYSPEGTVATEKYRVNDWAVMRTATPIVWDAVRNSATGGSAEGALVFKGTWDALTGVRTPNSGSSDFEPGSVWKCTVSGNKFVNGDTSHTTTFHAGELWAVQENGSTHLTDGLATSDALDKVRQLAEGKNNSYTIDPSLTISQIKAAITDTPILPVRAYLDGVDISDRVRNTTEFDNAVANSLFATDTDTITVPALSKYGKYIVMHTARGFYFYPLYDIRSGDEIYVVGSFYDRWANVLPGLITDVVFYAYKTPKEIGAEISTQTVTLSPSDWTHSVDYRAEVAVERVTPDSYVIVDALGSPVQAVEQQEGVLIFQTPFSLTSAVTVQVAVFDTHNALNNALTTSDGLTFMTSENEYFITA